MKNWKTTTAGILTLIGAAAYLGKKLLSGAPISGDDLGVLVGALTGVGLIAAKDHNK